MKAICIFVSLKEDPDSCAQSGGQFSLIICTSIFLELKWTMRKNSWKQVKLQKYLLIKVVQKNFKKKAFRENVEVQFHSKHNKDTYLSVDAKIGICI